MLRPLIGLLAATLSVASLFALASPPGPQWQGVEDALNQGLPRTAIERLDPLIERARREGATAEAIRAIGLKIQLQSQIQGNKPAVRIRLLEEALPEASDEMRPAMQAILAHWYWDYYLQHRGRIGQRTAAAEPQPAELETWDLKRIFAEIDRRFQEALAPAAKLQAIPIAEYDALLEKGSAPDRYRPTLYDFLVHDAIAFYAAGEQAGARPEEAFVLAAESPVFAELDDFLSWQPETSDRPNPLRRAVQLYQDVLRFHADDSDPAARLDANLDRLRFAFAQSEGETKTDRYLAALKRLESKASAHPLSTRALYHWASQCRQAGRLVKAHELAERAVARFPDSPGAKACRELITQIESPALQIDTERVWSSDSEAAPRLQARYKNLTQVDLRLVAFDFDAFLRSGKPNFQQLYGDESQREALLRRPAVRQWSATLPATADYQERLETISPPEDLPTGGFLLLATSAGGFDESDPVFAASPIWVSELGAITRTAPGSSEAEVLVVDNASGTPVPGATVQVYRFEHNQGYQEVTDGTTDARGLFAWTARESGQMLYRIRHRGQSVVSENFWHSQRPNRAETAREQTQFFTDRALYRPGQTIRYKGIALSAGGPDARYETLGQRSLTVVFRDANGQEIARRQHRTNDYGSFSGSFEAPTDRLTGQMMLSVEGSPSGATSVRVEAYKRPKFRVTLESPAEPPRLGAEVEVSGKAEAYTGVAIGNGKVAWRVVREVQYPIWWGWIFWRSPPSPEQQEIAHGQTETGPDGQFSLRFAAVPDPDVPAEGEPTFRFRIEADVTGPSGETRSSRETVTVGYTALRASLQAASTARQESIESAEPADGEASGIPPAPTPAAGEDPFLTDEAAVEVTVRTETLNGEPTGTRGTLRIARVEQPNKVARTNWDSSLPGPLPGPSPRAGGDDEQGSAGDPSDPRSWPLGEEVAQRQLATDASGKATAAFELEPGYYRARWESRDASGRLVKAILPLRVLDPDAERLSLQVPQQVALRQTRVEPGETLEFLWGSGYEQARALIEIVHRGKPLRQFWTEAGRSQQLVRFPVDESLRGGFTLRVSMVRENRAYLVSRQIEVPWTNKQLNLRWERFTSKLKPGAEATWTAIIRGPDASRAAAEMVASLYDASLDAYLRHDWIDRFNVFRRDHSSLQMRFLNRPDTLHVVSPRGFGFQAELVTYRHFPERIVSSFTGPAVFGFGGGIGGRGRLQMADAMRAEGMMAEAAMPMASQAKAAPAARNGAAEAAGEQADTSPELGDVAARTNLAETAFFFPHLQADEAGTVRMEFTLPDTLTEWRFLGFAHDRNLRSGSLTDTAVTAKDLMVEPNPPRFVRSGDQLEMTVKVSNQSPTRQQGTVRLSLEDGRTRETVPDLIPSQQVDQTFDLAAGTSQVFSWSVSIPADQEDLDLLVYKAVGATRQLSDGEEGYLPVLSRKILITESIGLPIQGPQTKSFDFQRLLRAADQPSIEQHALTLEMTSNPAWYAVQALPYLMEYPHRCSEQVFNRLYANALARKIVSSDPKIAEIFRQWRELPAPRDPLTSPLEQNEELRSVMLQESPWVRQAAKESQNRRQLGILFDENRLNQELANALEQLSQQQRDDGAWPWFPGGPANDFITLYIATGFGRLQHLGVDVDPAAALQTLPYLDRWMAEQYEKVAPQDREQDHLSPTIALYLYGRSFFLQQQPISAAHQTAFDYWVEQAQQHWLELDSRMSQGHLALALDRLGHNEAAGAVMASLRERSVRDDELGRFWRDSEQAWWWYRADIETQALMIEAFDEVSGDRQTVEQCKVWLLKQKQTQAWKSTKATADAVYALLLRGDDLLASSVPVEVELGGRVIEPETIEAGTGMFRKRFSAEEIDPAMGEVTVRKTTPGIAWGGLHWQYFQDVGEVTPHQGTPLEVEKAHFVRRNTSEGPQRFPVEGPLEVGDELITQLIVRTDRAMEYVHLKNERGSGTEPVNVLSGYRYADGLAFYESTQDTASHFFIDYLPKGTYVLETVSRVQLRGRYESGIATLQCMYAPEFNSHSESLPMVVE